MGVEDVRRLVGGNSQALAEAVGLHPVGQPVGHHLGLGPLGHRDRPRFGGEQPGRGRPVDVLPRCEGLDEAGVLGQVGDDPKLDLVVVGDEEPAPVGGEEGPADAASLVGADGNVVEVRTVRAETTRPRHRLVEAGVDAPVVAGLGEEALAVGGAQLLHLPVTQEGLDDGVLASELLQGGGVGGEPRLGLLLGLQAELVEQHLAELGRRVHLELHPGHVLDECLQLAAFGGQALVELPQLGHVDPHAHLLHAGEHPHQGALHLVVEAAQSPAVEDLGQGGGQAGDGHGVTGRLHGRVGGRAGQVELTRRGRIRGAHLQAEEALGEVVEHVLGLGRVDEIGRHRRVDVEGVEVEAETVQAAVQLLGVVGVEGGTALAEQSGQGFRHRPGAE